MGVTWSILRPLNYPLLRAEISGPCNGSYEPFTRVSHQVTTSGTCRQLSVTCFRHRQPLCAERGKPHEIFFAFRISTCRKGYKGTGLPGLWPEGIAGMRFKSPHLGHKEPVHASLVLRIFAATRRNRGPKKKTLKPFTVYRRKQ
jgi:hypothetical protein